MRIWNSDILRLLLAAFLAAIVSIFSGHFLYLLLLICIIYIVRQSILLNQVEQWLQSGAKKSPPSRAMLRRVHGSGMICLPSMLVRRNSGGGICRAVVRSAANFREILRRRSERVSST